jgi:putative pyruvate formate lyase activating enzyme
MRPAYMNLQTSGELELRVKELNEFLKKCNLCPNKCNVNRLKREVGACGSSMNIKVSNYGAHFGEEECLVGSLGSGTIFFTNCVMKCVYCQNYKISQYSHGQVVSEKKLSSIFLNLQNKGCHNINLVSPTQYLPQIMNSLKMAVRKGLSIPIVYNTGGYDSIEAIKLLDNIIDIYLPDFKYSSNLLCEKYSDVKNYYDNFLVVLREMFLQVGDLVIEGVVKKGLLIRHLVLPNKINNTERIYKTIKHIAGSQASVNIMRQYHPSYKAISFDELSRATNFQEYIDELSLARKVGLTNIL